MRSPIVLVALLAAAPTAANAQLPRILPPGSPWIDINYPKLFWSPRDGFTIGAYLGFIKQLSFEDWDLAPPYAAAIAIDGQISTGGSRSLTLDSRFPQFFDGWRGVLTLRADRQAKENYFGIGSATTFDDANVTSAQPDFYRMNDVRLLARGEVQRRIVGGLRILAGIHAERWRLEPRSGPSVLASDLTSGIDPTIGANTNDVAGRFGVVFDTRDDEVSTNRGVFLQVIHAVADADFAGDLTYTRTTVSAAAYVPAGNQVVLAGRVVGQRMGGTPGVGSLQLIETSDRPFTGLGGKNSHRALAQNRFLGRHKLLGNVDLRYHLLNIRRAARVTVLGFLDAGRVFEGESFRLTTDGLEWGGGIGLFVQMTRAGVLGTTVGYGPDGTVFHVNSRWPL